MIPKSLSASSIQVAETCLARWNAEYVQRGRGISGEAGLVGTSVHGGLEEYVKAVYIIKSDEPSLELLITFYKMSFIKTFGTVDTESKEYQDGLELTKKWFARTEIKGTVISVEVKQNFPVKFPDGTVVPFNYIFDRLEQNGPGSYTVYDYKTGRWAMKIDDLDAKIQARIYALAVQILHPDATEIWVKFDLLRYEEIGVKFTREDNIATWNYIKDIVKKIYEYDYDPQIADPDDPRSDPQENLNAECKFCTRKLSCESITKNIAVGGVFSIENMSDAIAKRAVLEHQMKAAKSALEELDTIILAEAKELDQLEFEGDTYKLNVGVSARRAVDGSRVENVIGPELFAQRGTKNITLKEVEEMIKGNELDDTQKAQLKGLIYTKIGEPTVKTSKKSVFK